MAGSIQVGGILSSLYFMSDSRKRKANEPQ